MSRYYPSKILYTRVEDSIYGKQICLRTDDVVFERMSVDRARKWCEDFLKIVDAVEAEYDMHIKPCPFCRGKARPCYGFASVECTGCGARITKDSLGESIEAWNRRNPVSRSRT